MQRAGEPGSPEDIARLNRDHVIFSWAKQSTVKPLVVNRAEGVRFWDADGKQYLDMASQLVNMNIGHQHPKVVAAIQEQAGRLCFISPAFATDVKGELARLMAEVTPGDLCKIFFTLGGGDANESAAKIARHCTERPKIISRYLSYHGSTYGASTLTGDLRRVHNEPGIPGVIHALPPNCYRCPFGQKPSTCARECVSHLETLVEYEGPDQIAAIMVEAITGLSSGLIIPVPDYLPKVRELCDRHGILLVVDEVMTGFGRTGEWFAVDHFDVVPDIMTVAKGITCGTVPLGGVLVRERVAKALDQSIFWTGLTYSGHPLACAAGVATLNVYREENLIENSRALGRVLKAELEAMAERHSCVGDVRSIGLYAALDLVADRVTKQPLVRWDAPGPGVMGEMRAQLMKNGVFAFFSALPNFARNIVGIAPPLCIKEEDLLRGLAAVDAALSLGDAALAR